ncbi:hypothetical protein FA316_29595, partial [Pseudomonas aeruginosa]|nr:hypothetical protein [Pseudomonas aeruginosa]
MGRRFATEDREERGAGSDHRQLPQPGGTATLATPGRPPRLPSPAPPVRGRGGIRAGAGRCAPIGSALAVLALLLALRLQAGEGRGE